MWIKQFGRDRIINIDTGTYIEIRKFTKSYRLIFVDTRENSRFLTYLYDDVEVARSILDMIFDAIERGEHCFKL